MRKLKRNEMLSTKGLLSIYLLVLIWIILFKMAFSFQELPHIREINLIPFADSAIINNQIDLDEIINNILIFVPFGIYMSMLKPEWGFLKKVIPIASVSLLLEISQFLFSIGATDITDFIGNTLGGIIGIVFYFILNKLFNPKVKINTILNRLASIGTISFIALMIILILSNG